MKQRNSTKLTIAKIMRYSTPITASLLFYLSYLMIGSILGVLAVFLLVLLVDMATGDTSVVDRYQEDNTDAEE